MVTEQGGADAGQVGHVCITYPYPVSSYTGNISKRLWGIRLLTIILILRPRGLMNNNTNNIRL